MINVDNGASYLARGQDNMNLKVNDWCVVRRDFFQDYGQIVQCKGEFHPPARNNGKGGKGGKNSKEIPKIIRKATVHDKSVAHENEMRAKSAFRTAQKHVDNLKLEMKLLNAHYSLDGKLIVIQFTADGRVDFRQLVKELSRSLNTRIELRQIGVRDETAILGGIGICGQELCCHRFLKEFQSINVRMAKDQDLSLTPSTISGVCGRLKCCLKYEHAGYLDLEKTMPRRGDMCECDGGRGRICDRNLLTQEVTVNLESGNTLHCPRSEVQVVYPEKYKLKQKRDTVENELDENDEELKKLED